MEHTLQSCADCTVIEPMDCKKYTNAMSKLVGFVLNSNRGACIARIKNIGYEGFALEMAENKTQTIKRK